MDSNLENTSRFYYNLRIYATDVIHVSTWGRDPFFWGLAEISEEIREGYSWKLLSFLNDFVCRQITIILKQKKSFKASTKHLLHIPNYVYNMVFIVFNFQT